MLGPGPVLRCRSRFWRHVRRGVRTAWLHLDARQVRSRLRLVSAPRDGNHDDHLVLCLLYSPHTPCRQRYPRRRPDHRPRLGLPVELALSLSAITKQFLSTANNRGGSLSATWQVHGFAQSATESSNYDTDLPPQIPG